MYIIRHLGHLVLTAARKAHKPRFWLHGVWLWLGWDGLMWLYDAAELLINRSPKVGCACCGWRGRRFFTHTYVSGTTVHRYKQAICPQCEALGRQRQLVHYLKENTECLVRDGTRILDIGPGPPDLRLFAGLGLDGLVTLDIRPGAAMLAMDVTRMGFKDDAFDLVVCSHVLEHVCDDRAALREMLRVIKPCGRCIVQVPIQAGMPDTIEYGEHDPEQFDHVRTYGTDFPVRLMEAGFSVTLRGNDLFEAVKNQPGRSRDVDRAVGRQH